VGCVTEHTASAAIYSQYKEPFLTKIAGAKSKELLVRNEDVQVLHGFDSIEHTQAYLESELFKQDVVGALAPLLGGLPEIRIYPVAA